MVRLGVGGICSGVGVSLCVVTITFKGGCDGGMCTEVLVDSGGRTGYDRCSEPVSFCSVCSGRNMLRRTLFSRGVPSVGGMPLFEGIISLRSTVC